MESLKIEIPKGFEVESFDQNTGEIKFREQQKEVTERIKNFDDVLRELEIEPDQATIWEKIAGREREEKEEYEGLFKP